MQKIIWAFALCWLALAPPVFACGVDTSSVGHKSSNGEGGKAQESKKHTQDSISGGGFGLTRTKDDRWEKVKKRLKKTQEGNGAPIVD